VNEFNDFERSLQRLAEEAQQHPPLSSQRQLALNQLMNAIWRYKNRLFRPQKGSWTPNLYEDFYNEALQKTFFEICRRIDAYNSEHSVLAWVNFLIKNHFISVVNDRQRKGITYLPNSIKNQSSYFPSLDDLDRLPITDETHSDVNLLRQFLKDDPENFMKEERLREKPEITFQYLALAKFVEDRTWEEISKNVGISIQTLCSFFNRRLHKLMPYFKKYLNK
jgi:DNA-directed RNA polymerase specialized sigma24 family protein